MIKNGLYAPKKYWEIRENDGCLYKRLTNGCGSQPTKEGWKRDLFGIFQPEKLFGLDIKIACDIHDISYVYPEYEGIEGKHSADRVFINNLLRLIDKHTQGWILKRLRLGKAYLYYKLVVNFGGPSFARGQEQRVELDQIKNSKLIG